MKIRLILVAGVLVMIFGGVMGVFFWITGDPEVRQVTSAEADPDEETAKVSLAPEEGETLGATDDASSSDEKLRLSLGQLDGWSEGTSKDAKAIRYQKDNSFLEVGLNSNRDLAALNADLFWTFVPRNQGTGVALEPIDRTLCSSLESEACEVADGDGRLHFVITRNEQALSSMTQGGEIYFFGGISDIEDPYDPKVTQILELAETLTVSEI